MKPNIQVRRNGGSKATPSQVPNKPDAAIGTKQKLAYLHAQSHESLEKLAQGYWHDPAARPVFNEWLASVPRETLENLAYFLMRLKPARQGTPLSKRLPSWLKIEHLTMLKVLANNRTKYPFNLYAITALAREFHQVELKARHECSLVCLVELGWVEIPSHDQYRITQAGRDVLQTYAPEAMALAA